MELTLIRTESSDVCTLGKLYIDGVETCYTLEDVVRPDGEKVYGRTAIPAGRYRIVVNHSNRLGATLPLLMDVPNFQGIRIHTGNVAADTEGCILVGTGYADNAITGSRDAFAMVFPEIRDAFQQGEEVWIEVKEM